MRALILVSLAACRSPSPVGAPTLGAVRLGGAPAVELLGGALDSSFGYALDGGCDVDGDGWDDLVVGAPWFRSYDGAAFVFRGGPLGIDPVAPTELGGGGGWFGVAVACVGDTDGDGFAEVAVGAPYTATGDVFVYAGSAAGVGTAPTVTITGESAYLTLGIAVAAAGDVDADGLADLLVGVYGGGGGDGSARLHRGGAAGLDPAWSQEVVGAQSGFGDEFGLTMDGAGDVDGDGFADVIVGGRNAAASAGEARVFRGVVGGIDPAPVAVWAGTAWPDQLGGAVAGLGDTNGDGFGEVLVTIPGALGGDGEIRIHAGSAAGPAAVASQVFHPGSSSMATGWLAAGPGDVDADGFADAVWVTDGAQLDLHLGSASGLGAYPVSSVVPPGYLGALGAIGDPNGDGAADIAIGDPGYGLEGAVWVYEGVPSPQDTGDTGGVTATGTAGSTAGTGTAGSTASTGTSGSTEGTGPSGTGGSADGTGGAAGETTTDTGSTTSEDTEEPTELAGPDSSCGCRAAPGGTAGSLLAAWFAAGFGRRRSRRPAPAGAPRP